VFGTMNTKFFASDVLFQGVNATHSTRIVLTKFLKSRVIGISKLMLVLPFTLALNHEVHSQTDLGASFRHIRSFSIPNELALSDITTLLPIPNGRFVITDQLQNRLLMLDSRGVLIKDMNPKSCFPGFDLQPIHFQSLKNGEFFLVNSGYGGFRFKADGTCIGLPDDSFRTPDFVAPTRYDGFVAQYKRPSDIQFVYMNDRGNSVDTLFSFNYKHRHVDFRMMFGGHSLTSSNLFFVMPSSTSLYRYDGIGVKEFVFRHRDAPAVQRDIASPMNLPELQTMFVEKAMTVGVHTLDEGIILQVVSIPTDQPTVRYALVVWDEDGNILSSNSRTHQRVLAAQDGKLYTLQTGKSERDPDFTVHIYSWVSSK